MQMKYHQPLFDGCKFLWDWKCWQTWGQM